MLTIFSHLKFHYLFFNTYIMSKLFFLFDCFGVLRFLITMKLNVQFDLNKMKTGGKTHKG